MRMDKIAALCHEQWSEWMKYLFDKCIEQTDMITPAGYVYKSDKAGCMLIPKEFVNRWKRQMETPFENLSDLEQKSDRLEANKFFKIFRDEFCSYEEKMNQPILDLGTLEFNDYLNDLDDDSPFHDTQEKFVQDEFKKAGLSNDELEALLPDVGFELPEINFGDEEKTEAEWKEIENELIKNKEMTKEMINGLMKDKIKEIPDELLKRFGIKPVAEKDEPDPKNHEKNVYKPRHYQLEFEDGYKTEVIDIIKAISSKEEYVGAMKFQACKYLMRADKKDIAIQDLKKARFYLDEWIKTVGSDEQSWKDLKDILDGSIVVKDKNEYN